MQHICEGGRAGGVRGRNEKRMDKEFTLATNVRKDRRICARSGEKGKSHKVSTILGNVD